MISFNLQAISDSSFVQYLGWFLVHSLWQTVIIGAVAAALLVGLSRSAANLRYCIAMIALGLAILSPLVTIALVSPPKAVRAVAPFNNDAKHAFGASHDGILLPNREAAATSGLTPPTASTETASRWLVTQQVSERIGKLTLQFAQSLSQWFLWIVSIWVVGLAFLSARLFAGLRFIGKLRASGVPLTDEICQSTFQRLRQAMGLRPIVRLVESRLASVPAVIGFFRPMILVPASMTSGLSVSELEAMLAHELAHIRRHDYLLNVIQTLAETLLFFHPVVWCLSRVIRIERENCCDDVAIAVCGNRMALAKALARMEELRVEHGSFAMAASGGSLVRRIRRVVGRDFAPRCRWTESSAVALGLLALFFSAIAFTIAAAEWFPNKAVASPQSAIVNPSPAISDDDEPPPEVTVLAQDDDRITKCYIAAQVVGRSPAELIEHFSLTMQRDPTDWQGNLVNQETIVSAVPRWHLPPGMDADEVNFSLPEGSGMRAIFSGEKIDVEKEDARTVVTITDGRLELIDAVGVTRATASPDGGAEKLIVECTTANQEAAMVIRTNDKECPVQVKMIVETGAPADEKDPPHGAIRYVVLPVERGATDPVRMKMQWHYDLKQLVREANNSGAESREIFKWPEPDRGQSDWSERLRDLRSSKRFDPTIADPSVNELDSQSTPRIDRAPDSSLVDKSIHAKPPVDDDWGPMPEKGTLRARLTLQTENKTVGTPLKVKLEIKNFGDEVLPVDPQYYAPFRVIKVTHADGSLDWFIGPTPQTAGESQLVVPGAIVSLWEGVDATELFMLDAGEYAIEVVPNPQNPELPRSNAIAVKLAGGELPPLKKALLSIKKSLPKEWKISTGHGVIFLSHSPPTGFKKDVTTIQIWFSPDPIQDDEPFGSGAPKVRYLGKHSLGHVYVAAPARAEALWPGCVEDVANAIGFEQNDAESDEDNAERPWSVTGRVTDAEGKPISGAPVAHCGMGTLHETGSATTDADGRYSLNFGPGLHSQDEVNLQAATISVHLDGHFEKSMHRQGDLLAANRLPDGEIGWGGKKAEDIFLPGKTKTIDFVMLRAARLRGTIVDQDGKRLSGVRVSLTGPELPPSSSVVANTKTNDEGRFELTDIPTGFQFQILVEPAKAESPWLAWSSPSLEFISDDSHDAHFRYSVSDKNIDFSVQSLTLLLKGTGINWRQSLEDSQKESLEPKYDGLSTSDGTIVSAGMAWIELGK